MKIKRVFLTVLDSFGVGYLPDAGEYGDIGSNTLKAVAGSDQFHTPNLAKLGLFNIDEIESGERCDQPTSAYGRMTERSKGKDTTIGHWEIAGVVSEQPLPTYPEGFPREILDQFSELTGRSVICNKPYSGTQVIADYGREHVETGALIVYTSADSVFQIAAHEEVVPLEQLYVYCQMARNLLTGEHGVGRVIARPFNGSDPEFKRTPHRHDYSLTPPRTTMLDLLKDNGRDVIAVGKISDIFAGRGVTESYTTKNNEDGMNRTVELQQKDFEGLCFTNLVDFDMVYGHRNDVDGYAKALTDYDIRLGEFMSKMKDEDVLIITADHGCDPSTESTDHSREYVPVLVYGKSIRSDLNLGTRECFGDVAATILDLLGIDGVVDGTSMLPLIQEA
jgi:phosphopentomutase